MAAEFSAELPAMADREIQNRSSSSELLADFE